MCLAACYSWIANRKVYGEKGPDIECKIVQDIIRAKYNHLLDDELTVLDAEKYLAFSNPAYCYTVTKLTINSIKDIKDATPVRFDRDDYGHWVVVENGKIVFDSLDDSKCVKSGKPTTARIIGAN